MKSIYLLLSLVFLVGCYAPAGPYVSNSSTEPVRIPTGSGMTTYAQGTSNLYRANQTGGYFAATMPSATGASEGVYGNTISYLGTTLTTTEGKTLYVFAEDGINQTSCTGTCAQEWPPYLVEPGARTGLHFGTITRPDGNKQWTIKGRPLYTYRMDQIAGDQRGQGLGGVWHTIDFPTFAINNGRQEGSVLGMNTYPANAYPITTYPGFVPVITNNGFETMGSGSK